MNRKLKSTKLWILFILIAFTGGLTYSGSIVGSEYLEFIKWAFGIYVVGNVGSKVAYKGS